MTGTFLHEVARAVGAWSRSDARVRACFWFGGYGTGEIHPGSDLDVALLLEAGADADRLVADLAHALEGFGVTHRVVLPGEQRATLWVGTQPTKVDVVLGRRAEDLYWLADAEDVPAPRFVSAWELSSTDGADLLARASAPREPTALEPRRLAAEGEIDKFVVGFDACSAAHARGDAYAFYFHYNLALGRLLRVAQLTRAGRLHLYLPRDLLAATMTTEEQAEYHRLAASFSLPDGMDLKRALADRFALVIREAREVLGVRRDPDVLRSFLAAIERRDLLYNVRDVATFFYGRLRPGVLFRAPALTLWAERAELLEWFRTTGVSDVVDLRSVDEAEERPYPPNVSPAVRIHAVPTEPIADPDGPPSLEAIRRLEPAMQAFAKVLAEAPGAVVLHCAWGRDRTGWLCALLLAALGLPHEAIERDYLASRMGTRGEVVRGLLDTVKAEGEARDFLASLGVDRERLEDIERRLLLL